MIRLYVRVEHMYIGGFRFTNSDEKPGTKISKTRFYWSNFS